MSEDLRGSNASGSDEFGAWFDREYELDQLEAPETQIGTRTAGSPGIEPEHGGVDGDTTVADSALPVGTTAGSLERVVRRVFRRPVAWWQRPWSTDRIVRVLVTSAILVTTTVVMMMVVHLNPLSPGSDLVFDRTTPTGGDMGAHVWAPAFLRDHFLPSFQLSGWSMDWYAGLPLYRFYMVIPALAIVALDVLLPYGVAFKLVAVSGLVLFPLACWAFGRLAAFRHPIPELFAVASLCFLLDESFSIYGGNVKSTMAGEYSFSIALTLAVLGLGLLANGLRTGRFRVWTAVVLSLAAVSHGIVLIFVAVGAIVLCLVWMDRRRLVYAVTTGVTVLLLSAWWVGPFLFGHEFMTDMKYGFRPEGASDSFWDMFFPLAAPLDFLITGLAIVGFLAMILRRNLTGTAIGLISLVFVALVYLTRDSLPGIGLLWNPRLLPFVYFTRYLLMVIGALELITWLVNMAKDRRASAELSAIGGAVTAGVITLSCLLVFGWMYETLPGGGRVADGETTVYAWGPLRKGPESGRAVADGWTRYNMLGYEGRPKYPEYNQLVTTMGDIGDERGCGRALWENNSANGEYGTTMALMLLPHWTDGCIASMEGLFFEASGTTPYHFLTAAAMSEQSSNPVRQLRYTNNDAEIGVQHMRDLGVRYLMVRTEKAKAEAAAQPALELLVTSGPWEIYELRDAAIVEALTVQPVVVEERGGDQRERNLEVGTSWFQRQEDWAAVPADDGPDSWQRIPVEIDLAVRVGEPGDRSRNVDYVVPAESIEPVALDPVEVSNIVVDDQKISFEVDQIGVPVLVRVSYFPTWKVDGAEGPYRVAPNFMVVVPTSNEVTLSYAKTPLDWFFYSLTLIGIVLCVYWRRRGDVRYASDRPAWRATPALVPAYEVSDTRRVSDTTISSATTTSTPTSVVTVADEASDTQSSDEVPDSITDDAPDGIATDEVPETHPAHGAPDALPSGGDSAADR